MVDDSARGAFEQLESADRTRDLTATLQALQDEQATIEGARDSLAELADDGDGPLQLETTGVLNLREADLNRRDPMQVSMAEIEEDPELFNFASAPYNASSALRGNPEL